MSSRTSKPSRRGPAPTAGTPTRGASLAASAAWTEDRIRALGAFTTLPIAAQILGISPAAVYVAVRADQADGGSRFPVPVTRVGRKIHRVPVPALLALLHPQPADTADTAAGDSPLAASPYLPFPAHAIPAARGPAGR